MPRDQALRKMPPPDRRCTGMVTDSRSKHVGEQCSNWAVHGSNPLLCAAHRGDPQRAYQLKAERIRILGVPEDVEDKLEDDRAAQARVERQRVEDQLAEHQIEVARIREEKRLKALSPPPLTETQKAEGYLYHQVFGVTEGQRVHALTAADGRPFVWSLIHRDALIQREREDLVNDAMDEREAEIQRTLEDEREKARRGWEPGTPLEALQARRNGWKPHEDDPRYAAIEVDLSPEALGLR